MSDIDEQLKLSNLLLNEDGDNDGNPDNGLLGLITSTENFHSMLDDAFDDIAYKDEYITYREKFENSYINGVEFLDKVRDISEWSKSPYLLILAQLDIRLNNLLKELYSYKDILNMNISNIEKIKTTNNI